MKKSVSVGLAILMLTSAFATNTFAADVKETMETPIVDMAVSASGTYEAFLSDYGNAGLPKDVIPVDLSQYTASEDCTAQLKENYNGKDGISLYTGDQGSVTFMVNIDKPGLYGLNLDYFAENSRGASIERKIRINDKYQHESAENIVFNRIYIDDPEGLGKTDFLGNDIRPSQVEKKIWQNNFYIRDKDFYISAMLFYFEKGVNTITFESTSEPLTIANLTVRNEEERSSYSEVAKAYEAAGYKDIAQKPILIQAEKANYKSDTVLYPVVDRTTPSTTPYEKGLEKLNSIGGYRWQGAGQFLTWNFEVPEDGLYTLYIKARQNIARGSISNRAIYIDGKIPFSEFEDYDFNFDKDWQLVQLGDKKNGAYRIYLTAGLHEIKIEANLGEASEKIKQVQNILEELNSIYTTIMTITGSKPDSMRDYYLDELIPEEIERMGALAKELQGVVDWYYSYTGSNNSSVSSLNTMIRQLIKFNRKQEFIAKNLDYFKTNIGSIGAWLITAQQQPLELDYIAFGKEDAIDTLPAANAAFVGKMEFGIRQFIVSFVNDYANIGSESAADSEYKTIKVWMSTGRDQAQALRKVIDSTFTAKYKINVSLELVNVSALLPATVAGIGPDIALNMGDTEPVNYAIRNAVIDLTGFSDFKEVSERFLKERMVPLTFNEKVYALPETQTFNVMFYRKDILNELGIGIPQTWEDVISVITMLQKNKMSFAVPTSTTAAPQTGVSTYYTMLYQHGGVLYNNKGESSALQTELGLAAFKQWTNLFVNYDLPKEYNFLDRFRTGEYPLIIGDFGYFNSLTVSAPEIRGMWSFTLLPGTRKEDGTIDRSMPLGGLCSFILKNSDNYEESWQFLKWWTDAETQVSYGDEMESILGASARYATANLKAFEQIPWSNEFYRVLKEQMEWGKGIEQVPGSYFTARHLDNAFRKVTISSQDAKETLFDYVYTIDQELTTKRKEFGIGS